MIFLIFPIHLFQNINLLKDKKVYLIEEPRYFCDFNYHKLKLAYHRATLKSYYNFLKSKKIDVHYIDFKDVTPQFYKSLNKNIEIYDPTDKTLLSKLNNLIPSLKVHETLNFLINEELLKEYQKNSKLNHQDSKKLNIRL